MLRIWLIIFLLFTSVVTVKATSDPLNSPNNRVGVHILDPSEVISAAKLVNSAGGDWGYVTIPIRSDDRDQAKWEFFFRSCSSLRLIPIIRLATYPAKDYWVTPTAYDLVDFANFLSDMPWPVKNRYVIIFNEPNHAKEWGGTVDPAHYATLLIQANNIFTTKSADYYILSAGLDMSAPSNRTSLDALNFYRQMTLAQPFWYSSIDGLSVHAYPNPNFTGSMLSVSRVGPKSYLHERQLLRYLGYPDKPLFITETGNTLGNDIYTLGFSQIWTEPDIVAITPFLLFAGTGDFPNFSLLDLNHQPKNSYLGILNYPKTAGSPQLNPMLSIPAISKIIPVDPAPPSAPNFFTIFKHLLFPSPSLLSLHSAESVTTITVEIVQTQDQISRGLSGRPKLAPDHGMLFKFSRPQRLTFWMKEMLFPLDFIWINNGSVVGINESIYPPSQKNPIPAVLQSPGLVDHVLEVNAGFVSAHKISIGDKVSLKK